MQQSLVASQAGAKVKSSEFQYLQKLFAGVVPPTSRQAARCTVDGVGNPASPECIRRLPLIAEQPLMPDTQVTTVQIGFTLSAPPFFSHRSLSPYTSILDSC